MVVVGDHRLRLLFADGTVGDVSFAEYNWPGVYAPLRDPAAFARVTIDGPSIAWPEHDLDWAPESLYEAARAHLLAPAVASAA